MSSASFDKKNPKNFNMHQMCGVSLSISFEKKAIRDVHMFKKTKTVFCCDKDTDKIFYIIDQFCYGFKCLTINYKYCVQKLPKGLMIQSFLPACGGPS